MTMRYPFAEFILAAVTGVSAGVYLYFPAAVTMPEARAKCESFGMTLMELRNEKELVMWTSVRPSLFRLQEESESDTWLGMLHDGSLQASTSNYRWLDAGEVTFLTWNPSSPEPDELPQAGCVRVSGDYFWTKGCNFHYSTVCQPRLESGDAVSFDAFRVTLFRQSDEQTYSRYRLTPVDDTSYNWLVALPLSATVNDVISCVSICRDSTSCFTRFTNTSGCEVFEGANLHSLH